ncbi:MAG: ABC transporter permease subunit [Proteobacteria bacterium]|nr:ABC transporter permease subunit [Pseudomonadota bacterium]
MKSLARFVFFRFLLRTLWIGLLATFGIQLLFTFLPPKRIVDPRNGIDREQVVIRKWKTSNYFQWVEKILVGEPQISDHGFGNWQVREFELRATNTLVLCGCAFLIASLAGIVVGTTKATLESEIVSGPRKPVPAFLSTMSTTMLFVLSSVPSYIIAYFLFLVLKSESHMFLAMIALALGSGSAMDISRLTFNSHGRELRSRYVENALTMGLKTSGLVPVPGTVVWHAFRNSLITILPVTAYRLPLIVSSALVVEVVFDLPGLGESLLISLVQQDVPMILTIVLISVVFVQACVFLADSLAYILHPQKYSG